MAQAVRGEALTRPWIGIRFTSINEQVKEDNKLSVDAGALVSQHRRDRTGRSSTAAPPPRPASRTGDIVLSINGIKIDPEHPLDALLVQFAPKETVKLEVLRDGKTITVDVTLGTRPANL